MRTPSFWIAVAVSSRDVAVIGDMPFLLAYVTWARGAGGSCDTHSATPRATSAVVERHGFATACGLQIERLKGIMERSCSTLGRGLADR